MAKNEIMNLNDARRDNKLIASFPVETEDDRKMLYNAVQTTEDRISDLINMNINITGVICQPVQIEDDVTGELKDAMRTILFDDEGRSFACASTGMYQAVCALDAIWAPASTWRENPVPAKIRQVDTKRGRTFTVELRA